LETEYENGTPALN